MNVKFTLFIGIFNFIEVVIPEYDKSPAIHFKKISGLKQGLKIDIGKI